MIRDINLLHYLPLFVQEYREIKQIMQAEEPEFQLVADESEVVKNNQFITTCDENGIARFEKILHITPTAEDTLQSRISRVLIRWNDAVPYTWKIFLQKMQTLCGNNFTVEPDWNAYTLHIITHLDLYGQIDELENMLDYIMPCNILVTAENILDYILNGFAYVGVGQAFADMFQLTDSFKCTWELPATAYVGATGSGTCEIELTDSFKDGILASDAEAHAFAAQGITATIQVSDTQ